MVIAQFAARGDSNWVRMPLIINLQQVPGMIPGLQRYFRHRFAGEFLIVTLGNTLSVAGLFVTLKIIATHLSLDQFGLFGLVVAFAGGISRIFFSPLSQAALRFTVTAREKGESIHFSNLLGMFFRRRALMVVAVMILTLFVFPEYGLLVTVVGSAVAILLGISVINSSQLAALRQRRLVAAGQIFTAFGRGIFALPFIGWGALQATGALAGYAIALLIAAAVQFTALKSQGIVSLAQFFSGHLQDRTNRYWPQASRYLSAFGYLTVLELLVLDFDKLVFAQFVPLAELGILVALQQLAKAGPVLATNLVEQFFYPLFFEDKTELSDTIISKKAIRVMLASFAVVAVPLLAVSLLIPIVSVPLIRFLLSDHFVSGAPLLPYLLAGYTLTQCTRILQAAGLATMDAGRFVLPKAAQVVVLFSLFILLVPAHGIMAAGYAFAASSVVYAGLLLVINYRMYKMSS